MTNLNFRKQRDGYDTAEVNNYIFRLVEEYRNACEKYNDLMRKYKVLEEAKQFWF